jgi:uncharacterized protein
LDSLLDFWIFFKVPPRALLRGETYNLTTDLKAFMKLQPDRIETQSVTAYGSGWIAIQGEKITHSVLITSEGIRLDWQCQRFEDLGPQHFAQLAELDVELVIFGSGERLRFPKPEWQVGLMQRRVGLETMDTQAACRTYNILAGEGRKVAAALLVEATASNN